jgi:multisubunit Na+/H+ antiporter MnhC subunit
MVHLTKYDGMAPTMTRKQIFKFLSNGTIFLIYYYGRFAGFGPSGVFQFYFVVGNDKHFKPSQKKLVITQIVVFVGTSYCLVGIS